MNPVARLFLLGFFAFSLKAAEQVKQPVLEIRLVVDSPIADSDRTTMMRQNRDGETVSAKLNVARTALLDDSDIKSAQFQSGPVPGKSLSVPRKLFSCPVPRFDSAPNHSPAVTNAPLSAFEVQSKTTADDAERFSWMNGHDLLSVAVRSEQGGAYGWIERKILEPEVVRFKKVSMTGPLVAAIKRRNPLCLLQPAPFFSMDW